MKLPYQLNQLVGYLYNHFSTVVKEACNETADELDANAAVHQFDEPRSWSKSQVDRKTDGQHDSDHDG